MSKVQPRTTDSSTIAVRGFVTTPIERNQQQEERLTYEAAAVHLANLLHSEAVKLPEPIQVLDGMCDGLAEVFPDVCKVMHIDPVVAETMKPLLADRLWAYTVVEHGRAETDDGYSYIFDLLVDGLRAGGNAESIRGDARRITQQFRAEHARAGA